MKGSRKREERCNTHAPVTLETDTGRTTYKPKQNLGNIELKTPVRDMLSQLLDPLAYTEHGSSMLRIWEMASRIN